MRSHILALFSELRLANENVGVQPLWCAEIASGNTGYLGHSNGCAHHGPLSVRAGPNPFSKTSYIRNINDLCGDARGRKLLALPWQALRSTRKAGTRAACASLLPLRRPGNPEDLLHLRSSGHPLAGSARQASNVIGDRLASRAPDPHRSSNVFVAHDQQPHSGLLFAGTHELEAIFTRQALKLEQWRSRFHAGQALPGISEEKAATIVHSELGLGLSQRKIQKLISKSRITDLRNGGQHSYVSARRLFWVIRELHAAVAHTGTAAGAF